MNQKCYFSFIKREKIKEKKEDFNDRRLRSEVIGIMVGVMLFGRTKRLKWQQKNKRFSLSPADDLSALSNCKCQRCREELRLSAG